jgi:hypothetical protein
LPPLLSAGANANFAATATAAPVPSAVIAAAAAYFSAAVTTASMFQRFRLPLCFNVSATYGRRCLCFDRHRHHSSSLQVVRR